MLSGVPAEERAAAWDEISAALTRFETADDFVAPCELIVVAGTT